MTATPITQEVFVAVDALSPCTAVEFTFSSIPSYGALHEAKKHVLKTGRDGGDRYLAQ